MAQVLTTASPSGTLPERCRRRYRGDRLAVEEHRIRTSFYRSANSGGRISCFFSENRKKEQAQKALESALGEKKPQFEKWSKEIKRREEAGGGGGSSGGGGWFRRRFGGGSDGDHFRQEAQQVSLTILGLIAAYAVLAKGDVLLAVVFNPLLVVLRSIRSSFTLLTSRIVNRPAGNFAATPEEEGPVSAKDRVVGKWRNG